MIRVRTPSRLHFGLFSLPTDHATAWLNQEGVATLPRRNFGGVGLMIDKPGIELTVECSNAWSADGPLAQRALHFAQTYCTAVGIQEAFHLQIESAAPEHAGLGTGTQLGLAVARALAELTQQPARDAVTLAKRVGRGLRSALGVHGFDRGGLLVEGGKTSDPSISPLLVHHDFPDDWQILLITPRNIGGTYGAREVDAFSHLAMRNRDERTTETLCRLVLLGMLPALIERDIQAFGEALYDFNRRVGEMFRPAQGGPYAHPRIEQIVRAVRSAGIAGVGQSSWGPTIFAVVPTNGAIEFCNWIVNNKMVEAAEIVITAACNNGVCLPLAA